MASLRCQLKKPLQEAADMRAYIDTVRTFCQRSPEELIRVNVIALCPNGPLVFETGLVPHRAATALQRGSFD